MILYLIDANNWAHRAASHGAGLPDTLGAMLDSFLRRATPTLVGAFWDPDGPSFRQELFPAYKEGRQRRPEVSEQLPAARAVFQGRRIRCVDPVLGAEADDMIGTVASKSGVKCVILSSDLDFLQLVGAGVFLGHRRRGENVLYGPQQVRERYGIDPPQWPDVLALAGKASNGIPGLAGIGMKGACRLIAQFGTLAELLKRHRQVERRAYRLALEAQADEARLYQMLTTIRTDIPIDVDVDAFRLSRGA